MIREVWIDNMGTYRTLCERTKGFMRCYYSRTEKGIREMMINANARKDECETHMEEQAR